MRRSALKLTDPISNKVEEHHAMGQSQNFPEDLTRFMQTNIEDPAVEVSRCNSYGWAAKLITVTWLLAFCFKVKSTHSPSHCSHTRPSGANGLRLAEWLHVPA